jgi:hypothetical protein
MFSAGWVTDCIRQGKILEHDTPTYRLRRSNSKDKVPFSSEDDKQLRKFIKSLKVKDEKSLKGNRIYQQFAASVRKSLMRFSLFPEQEMDTFLICLTPAYLKIYRTKSIHGHLGKKERNF